MSNIKKFFTDWCVEKTVFVFYILFLFWTISIHEPWFDEMQAWAIAKTAPLKDLLFLIPHYEGHPPFFHLLLAVPARLGVPWQIGLRFACVCCSLVSAYLILFKAPFSRWVRCCLPFTFFLFYQYGVIARPYSMLVLILILAAICFPSKNAKPFLFTCLLGLMCAFHLFGIAIAGGMAAAWLLEIKDQQSWKEFFLSLRTDKRFHYLLGLLAWAVLMLVMIMPASDAWANNFQRIMPVWKQAIYLLLALPADAVLTDVYDEVYALQTINIPIGMIINAAIVGLLVWGTVFFTLPRKYWKYMLLPYTFLIGVMFFYCARQHIGMCVLVALFAFWIAFAEGEGNKVEHPFIKAGMKIMFAFMMCMSLLWTVGNVYHDAKYSFFPGKEILAFLKKHRLEGKHIMSTWFSATAAYSIFQESERPEQPDQVNVTVFGTEISFFAGKNIFFNFNEGTEKTYRLHRYSNKKIQDETFAKWKENGLPEVLFGYADLDKVYGGEKITDQYVPVFQIFIYDMWKLFIPHRYTEHIYIRSDLVKSHGFEKNIYKVAPPVVFVQNNSI